MESNSSKLLEETIEVEILKGVLVERELQGRAAVSYRRRAIEEAIEVEVLKGVLVERELRGAAG